MYKTKAGVYRLVNNTTGYCYVGSTCDLALRINTHFMLLRKNKHTNVALQTAWNIYGENNFRVEIVALFVANSNKKHTDFFERLKDEADTQKLWLRMKEQETILQYPHHYNVAKSISLGTLTLAKLETSQ